MSTVKRLVATSGIFLFLSLCIFNFSYAEKIKVVASIAPLADFAKQVGGERAAVNLLLPPGATPHVFEPTPKAVKDVSAADIFIKIGAGLEFWAEKIIKSSAKKDLIIVDSSSGAPLIRDPHAHGTLGADPHIWLDPLIAVSIVTKIEKAFIRADPKNAGHYEKNASHYREKLAQLDREIAERVSKFRIREYVTFHPAWNYFSRRYGLRVAGVIEESPGREPGPRHVARIIKEIRRIGSGVVFVEPQFNPKIAEVIARESGARILVLDPIEGRKGSNTYIDMMRYNISVMESAMR